MRFRETGFRPLYHSVCAFELNDKLRTIAKDCPDAAKASHAVVYGYIDQKKGLMLELLGVGKQAPKNFLFKEAYQGKKIAFPASDVLDVEFTPFPELGARTLKQYESHIAKLKKYDVSEELEKSREFAFLDGCRDLQHPDNVMVLLVKEGLDTEKVMVRLIGPGDHVLIGTLLSQPSQGYGVNKGDTVNFNIQENEDKEIFCYLDLNSHTLTKADLEDGSVLKKAVSAFLQNKNDHNLKIVFAILRSSTVSLPCRVTLSDEAEKIIKKYNGSDGGPTPEELDVISAGMSFDPHTLKIDGKLFLPVFSSNEEMKGHDEGVDVARVQFLHAVQLAAEGKEDIQGIILNAFTEPFVVDRELFKHIAKMKPLFDEDKETEEPEQPEQPQSVDNQPPHRDVAGIEISVGKMDVFNYALYQNNVPPVRGIVIQNRTGNPVDGLSLRITSEFPFFKEFEAVLPTIPSGKPISLPDPHLIISGSTLADLTEAVNTTVTVELRMDGKTVDVCRGQMQVFAYDQWQGDDSYRDLLPAFVLPNHPAIPALIHDAADYLKKWGKSPSLEGYQMGNPNRVRELAAAAYAAIQKKNIVYAEPPASFSIPGQRIRTPETIMEQRLGTCMDMTLLYAACLEAMGLHPLLVLIEGHIFAGLWLRKRTPEEMHSANLTIDNIDELTKRFNNGSDEMTFVECTAMCSDNKDSFETAEKIAKFDRLSNPSKFEMAIDVKVARRTGIKPITSRVRNGGSYQIEFEEKPEDEMTSAPAALDISIVEAAPAKTRKVMTKRELWESKLLDLSQNNMLLNLPLNASVLPIMSSHIDELEDALADGHEFHLLPAAEWITDLAFVRRDENGKESKPIQWLPHIIKEMGIFEITDWPVSPDFDYNEKFRQEYRNHRLYTFCGQKELDQSLTNIYRAARSAQQENGVSSLYLAIGLLRWISEESQEPCYAPLILLPIEIIRKSANQGYALHARDEDPHFNTTLLEMLKQNYNIQIQGLDPLPSDEHGIDIRKTFALVRGAVYSVSSWDVIETCVVGNFSFAQFAMWNDIHTAGDCLENSKVVRSLMKGRMDWKIDETENLEDEHTYLPITLDATQLKAVKMAAHGNTFVLHGPPGTGKSQTITAMIANLIAQGKTVLFVAEKMAALSVVEKRLSSLGIGDFCLELHSEKANKKHVLTQLDKALSIKHPSVQSEYEEALKKAQESRSRLDGYAEHLHAVQRCGYSMRELIDLYETVRDSDDMIPFETDQVRELTREELEKHVPLIGQLTAAGESVDTLLDSPLLSVGLTSYSAEVRSSLRPSVEGYIGALRSAQDAGAAMAELFGIPAPRSRADFMRLASIAGLYRDSLGMAPLFADLLAVGCDDAYRYFDQQKMLRDEEEGLLKIWKFDSLGMDVAEYYSRHEAAGKKLLGRASAIAAVTGELQRCAVIKITYEQIPTLLGQVSTYQEKKKVLGREFEALPAQVKRLIEKLPTREQYENALEEAKRFQEQVSSIPGGLTAMMGIAGSRESVNLVDKFHAAANELWAAEERVNTLLGRAADTSENWVETETEFCRYLMAHPSALKEWGIYNQIRQECVHVGLKPVVDAFEQKTITGDIVSAYRKGIYFALINDIISTDDTLSSFTGATFNEAIQQFKRLDEAMLQYTRDEIYYRLASRIPTSWDSPEVGEELNLLRKAIGSNGRGISIRALFEKTPHILKNLCPCMLMSPNSVAQYLAHDNNLFDVVIFDEASQLPTCKAVGALSRAKDAVIVGDPKQMPPTSFFAGNGREVDDFALDDLDSILDDALALGIPSHHLQWHYRSRHESLIAFSNSQFYGNKMHTFPSANDRERHVTAVYVDGLYKNSVNVKEAEAVVAEIVRRFHDPSLSGQSIGVVTFNVKQQALIENLLARQFQKDPGLDSWANNGDDPLFVKNLENVQGDERDVILFSVGYGPDEKGHISMNFGPINKVGGGKRLNVAFSRARVAMTIFTSIHSSDIKLTENSPEGLSALREFLNFAEGQDIYTAAPAQTETASARDGILRSVCKAVEDHGMQCVTMVGHSDFHVDIAVVDPYEPEKYMMGILLDGDGYRRSQNTRDREVAQVGVLTHLGWTIYRIWSIDWWDNRERVIARLLKKLDELSAVSEKRHAERVAQEEANAADTEAREAEARRLKTELEAQAAEVVAEEAEADAEAGVSADGAVSQDAEKIAEIAEADASAAVEGTEAAAKEAAEGTEANTEAPAGETEASEVAAAAGATGSAPNTAASENKTASEAFIVKDYQEAELPEMQMTIEGFISSTSKSVLAQRVTDIVSVEGPILKDVLIRRLFSSCSIYKTNATWEAAEKALKASKAKNSKLKGVVCCWGPDQDPKNYHEIRVSGTRSADEIPVQEIRNAVCYVLQQKGRLRKEVLVKEAAHILGYKRLGKNLEAAIQVGIQYAKSINSVVFLAGGFVSLAPSGDEN